MSRFARLPAHPLCLIIALAAPAAWGADTRIDPGIDPGPAAVPTASASAADMPRRGMTMQAVEHGFGAPAQVIAAVGEPPITRWIYEDYTVYFDRHHVVHSVRNESSPPRGVGTAGRSDPHMAAR